MRGGGGGNMPNRLPLFGSMVKVALVISSIPGSEVARVAVVLDFPGCGFGPSGRRKAFHEGLSYSRCYVMSQQRDWDTDT